MNAASPAAVDAAVLSGSGGPVTVRGLRDFSDRLSPMLVKELRQGMRSPVFVWGLIAMNLFLATVVWLTTEDAGSEELNQAFFGAYCIVVCGLLPLRGANALHEELRGNTIDTLVLTRLSGWRITLGKWIAVAAQQVLTSITVLPYLIVRYFAGGLNVPLEIAWLGIFLLLGLLSAAVLTGFSWVKYFLLRAGIMLGITAASGAFCVSVLEDMYGHRNRYIIDDIYRDVGWSFFGLAGVLALHVMFFALDIGASKVAAISENRSTRRRLVGLVAIAVYFGIGLWSYNSSGTAGSARDAEVMLGFGSALAIGTTLILIVQALLERPINLAPVLQPFARKGWLGRLAGRVLYPGWPAGVIFSLLLLLTGLGIGGWIVWSNWDPDPPLTGYRHYRLSMAGFSMRDWTYVVCGLMVVPFTLPVPLVIYLWFFRKRLNWHFGTYVLMITLMVSVELLLLALASGMEEASWLKLGLPIPTMSWTWLAHLEPEYYDYYYRHGAYMKAGEPPDPRILHWSRPAIIVISLAVGAFWWIMALLQALKAFRTTSAAERELMGKPRIKTPDAAHSAPDEPGSGGNPAVSF